MQTREFGTVRRLTDRHDTGFAGFGYGGDRLFVVALVDCFDPPRYLVRADSVDSALEVAEECLLDTVSDSEMQAELASNGFDFNALDGEALIETLKECGFTSSPSGRIIWSDSDIRISEVSA